MQITRKGAGKGPCAHLEALSACFAPKNLFFLGACLKPSRSGSSA